MERPPRSPLTGGRKGSAPIDTLRAPMKPEGIIWPHKSFLDWMDETFPELSDTRNASDRDILIRATQRAVYHRIIREMKESPLQQE